MVAALDHALLDLLRSAEHRLAEARVLLLDLPELAGRLGAAESVVVQVRGRLEKDGGAA